jgi:hypothetical protein
MKIVPAELRSENSIQFEYELVNLIKQFEYELAGLINKYSIDNISDTPDFFSSAVNIINSIGGSMGRCRLVRHSKSNIVDKK